MGCRASLDPSVVHASRNADDQFIVMIAVGERDQVLLAELLSRFVTRQQTRRNSCMLCASFCKQSRALLSASTKKDKKTELLTYHRRVPHTPPHSPPSATLACREHILRSTAPIICHASRHVALCKRIVHSFLRWGHCAVELWATEEPPCFSFFSIYFEQ